MVKSYALGDLKNDTMYSIWDHIGQMILSSDKWVVRE